MYAKRPNSTSGIPVRVDMPLAATVKSHMLRLLRRSKSTRTPSPNARPPPPGPPGHGLHGPAMVIPNKQNTSPPVIAEPFPITLGSAAAPQPRHARPHAVSRHASHHQPAAPQPHAPAPHGAPVARSRSVSNRREPHRPHSSARRARAQVWSTGRYTAPSSKRR